MTKRVFSLVLISLFSAHCMAQKSSFEIQGHRGCRGLLPENTIEAFYKAIDLGVQTLELDVVISKDKQVVVSHDPFFNPDITTAPDGSYLTEETKNNLYHLDYKSIKKYDVGLRGNPNYPQQVKQKAIKPLLSKMLKATEKYAKSKGVNPLKYNIEIKSLPEEYNISQPEVGEFSDLVHDAIFSVVPVERVTIQSFDFNVLKYWYTRINAGEYQEAELVALIEPFDNNDIDYNLKKLGFKPAIWSPYFAKLTKEDVAKLHNLGIKVIPWTVNEVVDMEAVKEMGCDGLITDYPDRAIELFN